jgi:hypothetical protein
MKATSVQAIAAIILRRFLLSARGTMTIPAIVFMVMIMAAGGFAIDLQRLYGAQGQVQAYVDEVALSAAGELDGQSGALTRAFDAAAGGTNGPLITGTGWQKLATDASSSTTLSLQKVTFLSQLDTDPSAVGTTPTPTEVSNNWVLCTYTRAAGGGWNAPSPANCNTTSANEKAAKFVEVVVRQQTVSYVVLPVINAIANNFASSDQPPLQGVLRLRATAGYIQQICDIAPMVMCNPNEPVGNANTAYPYTPTIGTQICMRTGGSGTTDCGSSNNGSAWVPGDFGWTNPPAGVGGTKCTNGSSGNPDLGCVLGLVDPLTQCIANDRVNVQPGEANSTSNGLNVRFDIYPSGSLGPANNTDTDSDFAPSVNVTKGVCRLNGGNCNYNGGNACSNLNQDSLTPTSPATQYTVRLPRDATFSNRVGNGSWDRSAYWSANHSGLLPASLTNATRYQMYRYEIDNNLIPNKSGANGENGDHTNGGTGNYCSSQPGINNPNRDRRILILAVINCVASGVNGNANNIPVVAYVKVFLTEPVGLDSTGAPSSSKAVYGEVIDVVKPNDVTGVVHIFPILFR